MVTISSDVPSITTLATDLATINEDQSVTLTGVFVDPDATRTHVASVNWGDGTVSAATVDPVARTFAATHRYLDNPAGAPHGGFTITAAVLASNGGSASKQTQVQVDNVAPTVLSFTPSATTIQEDGTVSVSGTISDPGTLDTQTVSIAWGDGSASAATVDAVARTFTATHRYRDNPTGDPAGSFTVTATATDKDGEQGEATTAVQVTNAAPVVQTVIVSPGLIAEGKSVSLAGGFLDAGTLDTHTVLVTVAWPAAGRPYCPARRCRSARRPPR